MAYSELLIDRIKQILDTKHIVFEEQAMMGRFSFLINGKFAMGVWNDNLEVRIDPELLDRDLKGRKFTHLDGTGKRMRGFIIVDPAEFDMYEELEYWLDLALDYNRKRYQS